MDRIYDNNTCFIVIGMAGSGKTTFVNQFQEQLRKRKRKNYFINLDPAVQYTPYSIDYDVKKKVNYKEIMKNNKLGPNGAIMTSLNIFVARYLDEFISEIQKQCEQKQEMQQEQKQEMQQEQKQEMQQEQKQEMQQEYKQNDKDYSQIVIDTPGQLEVFTWSASGQMICDAISKPPQCVPSILVYILDAVKCQSPNSFMSNMMFGISIMYKMKLPLMVVLNKADIVDTLNIQEWITDFDKYNDALQNENNYLSNLSRSMSLHLDEFYEDFQFVPVSSLTGNGFDKFFQIVPKVKQQYYDVFIDDIRQKIKISQEAKQEKMEEQIRRIEKEVKDIKI